jgi:ribosomal protein S18 acetylase RimI-like enzyme
MTKMEGNDVPPAGRNVREATRSDAEVVAALHVAEIHEGFLATLGARFLGHLYARIVSSPHGFLIVTETPSSEPGAGRVNGFVAGAVSVRSLYREFLWHDGFVAAVTSAPQLVRSLPRVVETLRYGSRQPPGEHAAPGPEAELLSLAVAGDSRRQGLGGVLVDAFLSEAASRGCTSARVVVGASNDTAVALYGRGGFETAGTLEVHEGTPSLLMRADVSRTGRR